MVAGYNHKLNILMDKTIDKIVSFQVKKDRFAVVKVEASLHRPFMSSSAVFSYQRWYNLWSRSRFLWSTMCTITCKVAVFSMMNTGEGIKGPCKHAVSAALRAGRLQLRSAHPAHNLAHRWIPWSTPVTAGEYSHIISSSYPIPSASWSLCRRCTT